MLVPNKMQHVICTGNVGDQYQELCGLAPNVCMVQGDFDLEYDFPPTQIVQVGQFRIGVLHGHQMLPYGGTGSSKATAAGDDDEDDDDNVDMSVLDQWRRKLGVDILITGNTHQNSVRADDGHYFINPGSITGAFSSSLDKVTPSFILLAVQESKLTCYVYELVNDEVEVTKTEFTKPAPADASSSGNPALLQSLLA